LNRSQKAEEVKNLQMTFQDSELVVVTHYRGLTVAEVTDLRNRLREGDVSYKVSKNTLARLAVKDTAYEGIADLFSGPTAIAASQDPIAAAKITVNYSKENEKLVIVGGSMNGKVLDVDAVKALAALPSLDELRAKLVGMLATPATRMATVLQAPATQLARVTSAHAEKG
jgi:large subunit ribosomal protein L10